MPSHTSSGHGKTGRLASVTERTKRRRARYKQLPAHQHLSMPQVEVYGETFTVGMDAISLKEGERPTDLPGVKEAMESAVQTAREDAARNGSSDATGDAPDSASDSASDATGDGSTGSTYTRKEVQDVVARMRAGDADAHKEFEQIREGTVTA